MDDFFGEGVSGDKFKDIGLWIGGIVAAIVVEALLARLAQRCLPGLFPTQQQAQPPVKTRR